MSKAKPKVRRVPKILSDPLYCYVEPGNGEYARTKGKEMFGSFSSYVNVLIANDRGVKPTLGDWKAKGEAKATRKAKVKVKVAKKRAAKKPVAPRASAPKKSTKSFRKSAKKIAIRKLVAKSKSTQRPSRSFRTQAKSQKVILQNLTKAQLIQMMSNR